MFALIAALFAACGHGEQPKSSASGSGKPDAAKTVEQSFLGAMDNHHRISIAMGKVARKRGEADFVTKSAGVMVSTQKREIGQMRLIHKRLFGSALRPDRNAHDVLGLPVAEAELAHSAAPRNALLAVDRFDRSYLSALIPHHRGAIRMSRVVLRSAQDPALRNLAETIIASQRREVQRMRAFRRRR